MKERPQHGKTEEARKLMAVVEERQLNEADLVAEAQGGSAAAFEALYQAHAGRVHAVCLRMVANRAIAEDLTQEAFVRAWQRLGTFRGASVFSTWLTRVAVNVALGHLRSENRHLGRLEVIREATPKPSTPATAAKMDLETAIAALPDGARTVFVLHDVEGYRHEDIAERLDVAVGTSKAQLHRARKLLREELEQ